MESHQSTILNDIIDDDDDDNHLVDENMEKISDTDPEQQQNSLNFFAEILSESYESGSKLILSHDTLIPMLIGLALCPPTENIMASAFHCLSLASELNVGCSAIEKTPELSARLVQLLREGCPFINDVINILCFLFDCGETRENLFSLGIVDVIKDVCGDIDASKLITMTFRYKPVNEEIVPLIENVLSWLETEEPGMISCAFMIFGDLIMNMREKPELAGLFDIAAVHDKAISFVTCENVEVMTSAFYFLEAINEVQTGDVEECCVCFSVSDQSAQSVTNYLNKVKEQWIEEHASVVSEAIIENIMSRRFTAKRSMLSLLTDCIPHLTSVNENLPQIYGSCLDDKFIGNTAIIALGFLSQAIAEKKDNEWFFTALEDFVDEITEYASNSNQDISDAANTIISHMSS